MINYKNGNYTVKILEDGTKIRESSSDILQPDFPESLDIKITNYCDAGCSYCHEKSTIAGKHCDLSKAFDILKVLPSGTEIAIGGGNPMAHPKLKEFLELLRNRQYIVNITINEKHLDEYGEILVDLQKQNLIKAIGISYVMNIQKVISYYQKFNNAVIHIIIGCHSANIIEEINKHIMQARILLLGYKDFGRGVEYKKKFNTIIVNNILDWYRKLRFILKQNIICLDNLGLEQLNPKRLFLNTEEYLKKFMGYDGEFSMYIDFVNMEYSKASFQPQRSKINDISLYNFFQTPLTI
jgi:hypothetical protein